MSNRRDTLFGRYAVALIFIGAMCGGVSCSCRGGEAKTYPNLADLLEAEREGRGIKEKSAEEILEAGGGSAVPDGTPEDSEAVPLAPKPTGLVCLTLLSDEGPCAGRIRIYDPRGRTVGALSGLDCLWAEGSVTVRLPVGMYNVDVTGGRRRMSWLGVVEAKVDETTRTRATLSSYAPVFNAGWWAVDPFVDVTASSAEGAPYHFRTLNEFGVAARGEGIACVGLAGVWGMLGAQGIPFRELQDGAHAINETFRLARRPGFQPIFSHQGVLAGGATWHTLETEPRSVGTVTSGTLYFKSLATIRDRGGFVILDRPTGFLCDVKTGASANVAGELIFDVVAGLSFDALGIGCEEDRSLWQMLLNHGYRLSAVGGGPGDGRSDSIDTPSLGCYAWSPAIDPTVPDALVAFREGRLILSNGPFARLQVEKRRIGDTIRPATGLQAVFVEALACSAREDSIARVELVYNGQPLISWKGDRLQKAMQVQYKAALPDVGWLAVRYYSQDEQYSAMSNPVYITAPGFHSPPSAEARVTLSVLADATDTALPARVEVWHLNTKIGEHRVAGEAVTISVPAKAVLRVFAEGYAMRELSIYRDGGPAEMIASLRAAGRLRAAMLEWNTYEAMRRVLQDVTLTVRMR